MPGIHPALRLVEWSFQSIDFRGEEPLDIPKLQQTLQAF
jgi:hypothetical protein